MNALEDARSGIRVPSPEGAGQPPGSLDDQRLLQAVEEYRALLEGGPSPNRPAFLARYPDIAEALAECLDGLEFIRHAGSQLQPAAGAPRVGALEVALGVPLGDFRILREVGRGGMGVVYEAEQLSLGRRVALKVLPLAAALDVKQLQRFKHDAQAAAHLHHQHILPVYAVGSERGVHYYAMQYIDGQTLAALIRDLRQRAGLAVGEAAVAISAGGAAAGRSTGDPPTGPEPLPPLPA